MICFDKQYYYLISVAKINKKNNILTSHRIVSFLLSLDLFGQSTLCDLYSCVWTHCHIVLLCDLCSCVWADCIIMWFVFLHFGRLYYVICIDFVWADCIIMWFVFMCLGRLYYVICILVFGQTILCDLYWFV